MMMNVVRNPPHTTLPKYPKGYWGLASLLHHSESPSPRASGDYRGQSMTISSYWAAGQCLQHKPEPKPEPKPEHKPNATPAIWTLHLQKHWKGTALPKGPSAWYNTTVSVLWVLLQNHPDLLFTAFLNVFIKGAVSLLHATLLFSHRVKRRLRSIILVLKARNRSLFLNTFMDPEGSPGWLPRCAVQQQQCVQETTVITLQSPGVMSHPCTGPAHPTSDGGFICFRRNSGVQPIYSVCTSIRCVIQIGRQTQTKGTHIMQSHCLENAL